MPDQYTQQGAVMSRKWISLGFVSLALCLGGCSTIKGAYDGTVDTVSGWFKSDSKPADDKK
jgi:hypothetical protein